MRYVAPYGISDPNAGYINGNPAAGIQGSIPPAEVFESPQRELVNFLGYSAWTPAADDLTQITKAIRGQAVNFIADTGAVNALVVTLTPTLAAYTVGLPIRVRVLFTNTGPATINAGPGIVPIKRATGAALQAGDLSAGQIAALVFDGTNFQLENFTGIGGGGGTTTNNFTVKIPYVADSSSTANIIQAPFSPAITSLTPGDPFLIKLANTNTGPVTLIVNGLTGFALRARDGSALIANQILAGEVLLAIWDGVLYRLIGVSPVTSGRYNNLAVYSTAGVQNFTVPGGVFLIYYEGIAGGGSGGSSTTVAGGGAGAQGGKFRGYLAVTPGQIITMVIGNGGAAVGAGGVGGNAGGTTSFGGTATATGGGGGAVGAGPNAAAGGNGGSASGGMYAEAGQFGQASNTPSANSNYPMGGGLGGNNFEGGVIPGSGGAPGNNTVGSGAGKDGMIQIHF
jgi:hypothetical protein